METVEKALAELLKEQQRTNELLERLIDSSTNLECYAVQLRDTLQYPIQVDQVAPKVGRY